MSETGAERYFTDKMKDPEYRKVYQEAVQSISAYVMQNAIDISDIEIDHYNDGKMIQYTGLETIQNLKEAAEVFLKASLDKSFAPTEWWLLKNAVKAYNEKFPEGLI